MSNSLSTCYNNLGLGRWEELCHEVMSSVLPMNDPGMSGDDLSSPTWRIIFLKDDCFLQPSCDMTASPTPVSSCTDSLAPYTHHRNSSIDTIDDDDEDDDPTQLSCATPSLPSSIEPLFDGIDLNHHHYHHQQRYALGYDQIPPSPSLSRSSSSPSLSDAEEEAPSKRQPPRSIHLTVQQKPRTKKSPSMHHPRQNPHHHPQQKRRRKHGSNRPPLATTAAAAAGTSDVGLTLFEQLSMAGIDWCRYCGTTEGVNWRPGPWGKRTLCK